jgi:hypothetical protein
MNKKLYSLYEKAYTDEGCIISVTWTSSRSDFSHVPYFLKQVLLIVPHSTIWSSISGKDKRFISSSRRPDFLWAYTQSAVLSPALKQPEREGDHFCVIPRLRPSRAIPLSPPTCLHGVDRDKFSLAFCYLWTWQLLVTILHIDPDGGHCSSLQKFRLQFNLAAAMDWGYFNAFIPFEIVRRKTLK